MSLKVVSINIEGQKHLQTVGEFLRREAAEVVCLMEAYEVDLKELAGEAYPYLSYGPNIVVREAEGDKARSTWGVAILSKQPIKSSRALYSDGKNAQTIDKIGMGTHSPIVLMAKIGDYEIGAVHFTWTPKASVTEKQRRHIGELLKMIKGEELVLCGDFNIPRGNEMYQKLLTNYRDNIPADVETTIDPTLHYGNLETPGRLKLVVDYVWSTPRYKVSGVRVVSGVSDHCGVVGEVILSG